MIIKTIRKNIGIIIAAFGFFLLCIITFGDLGEFMTEAYWHNVRENLMAISCMSFALTLIQTVIKQGIAEQALQKGLNTDNTAKKYEEHKQLIQSCTSIVIYMPYFLQIYNERQTKVRKREFLVANNFTSEKTLYLSPNKKLIKKYENIRVQITVNSIKWATTEIVYDKRGRIIPLSIYKRNQLFRNIIISLLLMVAVSFLTKGLFFDTANNIPVWQKIIKLFTYIIVIFLGSILDVIKNYEKGAFSVPNELDEINEIWQEFKSWTVPAWVIKEIESITENMQEARNESKNEKERDNAGNIVQAEQEKSESVQNNGTNNGNLFFGSGNSVFCPNNSKLDRQCNGNSPIIE